MREERPFSALLAEKWEGIESWEAKMESWRVKWGQMRVLFQLDPEFKDEFVLCNACMFLLLLFVESIEEYKFRRRPTSNCCWGNDGSRREEWRWRWGWVGKGHCYRKNAEASSRKHCGRQHHQEPNSVGGGWIWGWEKSSCICFAFSQTSE